MMLRRIGLRFFIVLSAPHSSPFLVSSSFPSSMSLSSLLPTKLIGFLSPYERAKYNTLYVICYILCAPFDSITIDSAVLRSSSD